MSKERLTIDEIIAHCKRMTQKFEKYNKMDLLENNDMETGMMKEYWEHRQVAEYLEELKQYRELEEQGLLLRLPCKVGDTLYIPYSRPRYIKEVEVRGFLFDGVDFYIQTDFVTFFLRDINVCVFLTQSEAEEKLRELERERSERMSDKMIAIMGKPKDCENCVFGFCKYSTPLSTRVKGYICRLKLVEDRIVDCFDSLQRT